jgi:hypothetical protein
LNWPAIFPLRVCVCSAPYVRPHQIPFMDNKKISGKHAARARMQTCHALVEICLSLGAFLEKLDDKPFVAIVPPCQIHSACWMGRVSVVLRTGCKGRRHGAASNPASSTGTLHRLRIKPAVCALVQLLPFDAICPLRALPYFCPCAEL